MSESAASSMVSTVTITTREGSSYKFPDVLRKYVLRALPETGRTPAESHALLLLNLSGAVLSLPLRIVATVAIEEEVLWVCPA